MNGNTELNIKITLDNLNVALAALGTMPFDKVADLINDIRSQGIGQLQAMQNAQQQPDLPGITEHEGAAE